MGPLRARAIFHLCHTHAASELGRQRFLVDSKGRRRERVDPGGDFILWARTSGTERPRKQPGTDAAIGPGCNPGRPARCGCKLRGEGTCSRSCSCSLSRELPNSGAGSGAGRGSAGHPRCQSCPVTAEISEQRCFPSATRATNRLNLYGAHFLGDAAGDVRTAASQTRETTQSCPVPGAGSFAGRGPRPCA